ncbi:receptor-like protein EIX2 [Castanea sativa]|uniref:receptor-like protein EIX2 n=1 Tax=Castanea sativa TaxID=21020 RepID=UPI003F64D73A
MASMKTTFLLALIFLLLQTEFISLEAIWSNSSAGNSTVGCIDMEREALLKFKEGLDVTSGTLSSWVGEDCCNWLGVGCSNRTGNIIKLDLNAQLLCDQMSGNTSAVCGYPLRGVLSPSLLELKYLNYLNLSYNDLRGTIPPQIGNLSNLLYLDLSDADFNGTIPPQIGNLSNLLYLDLSWNFLTASNLNWLSGLSSLKYLNLNDVDLSEATTDWLQTVNLLPSLLELHLSDCELHHLPQNFPSVNFTSLSVLDLSGNDFNSSSIPQWVFNFTSLTKLQLWYCNLAGSIPKIAKGNLCKLQTLDLFDNNLSGEITEFFQALSECSNSSLEELYLSRNKLIGNIPHSLGNLKRLRELQLHINAFSGSIPSSIQSLSHLRELQLFSNAFSGSIPLSIQNLSCLEILSLYDNKMNGTIPESIGQLSELRELHLSGNYWQGIMTETHFLNLTKLYVFSLSSSSRNPLVFNVTHDWIPPFSLQYVKILDCRLNPTFPAWLRTQNELTEIHLVNTAISDTISNCLWNLSSQLVELDLSHNNLMGNLPKSLNLSSLQRVYLDFNHLEGSLPLWPNVTVFSLRNNSLSGPIPIRIGQEMSQLVELDLSDNSLNGSIPSSINGLRVLGFLRLSNNHFSGNIHNHWQGMLDLFFIDLSRNYLSGGIPSSMCSLPYLSWLQLSNNNLSGNLSLGLKFLSRQISTLDFGGNRLSGTIPEWIGERNFSIKILSLRGNMLYGKIPKQLCGLTNIHVLDLAHNNFSGSIPTCLGSLVGYIDSNVVDHMNIPRYMDLVVKGRQYEYNDEIFLVKIMDFSRNNLSGEIPAELTSLTLLNSLNLSWNQLTGKIPENIGSLRQLETLDLSSNHLSGHIPPSMSSMTFLSHLNLSYNNLSGQIPSTNQFQTFNDPSIYEGNPYLYGPPPLPTSLSMPRDRNAEHKDQEDVHVHNNGEDQFEKLWFYLSIALGFIVGFWVVCGSLLIKKSWRHTYFCFAEKMKDRLLVVIALNMAHLQRKIQAERH